MSKPEALVICGDGINCDRETIYGLTIAGFNTASCHVSELLEGTKSLAKFKMICLPGGFSFGDEIASGKVLAIKLKEKMQDALDNFINQKKLLLGTCNGFQILVQLGLLPNSKKDAPRMISLTKNEKGKFINKWVTLEIDLKQSSDIFYRNLKTIELPIRHGEGRILLGQNLEGSCDDRNNAISTFVKASASLRYQENINGSYDRIASLTNEAGTVMGLMPHPEAFVRWTQHPQWTDKSWRQNRFGSISLPDIDFNTSNSLPDGLAILRNAATYAANAF